MARIFWPAAGMFAPLAKVTRAQQDKYVSLYITKAHTPKGYASFKYTDAEERSAPPKWMNFRKTSKGGSHFANHA